MCWMRRVRHMRRVCLMPHRVEWVSRSRRYVALFDGLFVMDGGVGEVWVVVGRCLDRGLGCCWLGLIDNLIEVLIERLCLTRRCCRLGRLPRCCRLDHAPRYCRVDHPPHWHHCLDHYCHHLYHLRWYRIHHHCRLDRTAVSLITLLATNIALTIVVVTTATTKGTAAAAAEAKDSMEFEEIESTSP